MVMIHSRSENNRADKEARARV